MIDEIYVDHDLITFTFLLGWIAAVDDKKDDDKAKSNSPDAILYEPIEKEKKKDPEPVYSSDEVYYE